MIPLLLSICSLAHAQDGFDAHGAFPAPLDGDARDPILLQRPGRMNAGEAYAAAMLELIESPLVEVTETAGATERVPALDNVFAVDVMGGYAIHDRFRIDLLVPVFLTSQSLGTGQGADLGDIRLGGQVALLRPETSMDGVTGGLGVAPWVTLPTGDSSAFLGQGNLAGGFLVNGTLEAGRFVTTGMVGPRFVPSIDSLNLNGADSFDMGVSAGLLATAQTGIHIESRTSAPFVANEVAWRGTPSELVASVRHRTKSGLSLVFGAGTSATPAVGSPAWRLMLGGGWGQVDNGDEIDLSDLCPDEEETVNGYLDDDGCPDRLSDLLVTAEYDGSPYPESDIRLQRTADPMPSERQFDFAPVRLSGRTPGEHWSANAELACMSGAGEVDLAPGDNLLKVKLTPVLDSKVTFIVVDNNDKLIENATLQWVAGPTGCAPAELTDLPFGQGDVIIGAGEFEVAGTAAGYETRLVKLTAESGAEQEVRIQLSPTRLTLEAGEIRILEKVHFETNSHVIKPVSYQLLSEVAATIVSHPEFGQIEVAGHADERGPDKYNQDLSARRANSVRDYLLKEGVNGRDLVTQGYGEAQPLITRSDAEAWSENRRVQFNILGLAPYEEDQ